MRSNNWRRGVVALGGVALAMLAARMPVSAAQGPANAPPAGAPAAAAGPGGRGGGVYMGIGRYPTPPGDPAAIARGQALAAQAGCASCHAADFRGAEQGANLLRIESVRTDVTGANVGAALRNAAIHGQRFAAYTDQQALDLTIYLRSIQLSHYDPAVAGQAPFVLGDPAVGRSYFAANCARCHATDAGASSSGPNLAGLATRIPDPKALQSRWISPPATRPVTARVTERGQTYDGAVLEYDEFHIKLRLADASERNWVRNGTAPRVVVTYPLEGHAALLPKITDPQIHAVTAYLATFK